MFADGEDFSAAQGFEFFHWIGIAADAIGGGSEAQLNRQCEALIKRRMLVFLRGAGPNHANGTAIGSIAETLTGLHLSTHRETRLGVFWFEGFTVKGADLIFR